MKHLKVTLLLKQKSQGKIIYFKMSRNHSPNMESNNSIKTLTGNKLVIRNSK